ncbi:MAG: metal ABC transporter substrate-binding protein [Candidatus Caldarchaeum sp.]
MYERLSTALLALSVLMLGLSLVSPLLAGEGERPSGRVLLATTTVLWDLARNVAGDLWTVEYLVEPGQNPHSYEPTPQDMVKAQKATLILYNGLNLDAWVVKLLSGRMSSKMVRATEGLEPYLLTVPDGPYAGREDPHLWMDVKLVVKYVERIRGVLSELDPENAAHYAANADEYIQRLKMLDEWVRSETSKIPVERRILVTQENAFQYFARAYGFKVGAYFYSIATEIEPTAQDLVYAVSRIKELGVCVYFVETTLSRRAMETLIREAGGRIGSSLYADSLGTFGSGADSYIGMMRHNVERIVEELLRWC